jgi:polyisoprenoid-binding protein YceI
MRFFPAAAFMATALLLASCQRAPGPDSSKGRAWISAYGPPPGQIVFEGGNAFRSVRHVFKRWRFLTVEADPATGSDGGLELEIDMTSVETGSEKFNRRARSAGFFDVESHPTARMRVGNMRRAPPKGKPAPDYTADMEIDFKGSRHTLPLEFEVINPLLLDVAGRTTLSRKAFGLGSRGIPFNPFSIRDEIEVSFAIRFPPSVLLGQASAQRATGPALDTAGTIRPVGLNAGAGTATRPATHRP